MTRVTSSSESRENIITDANGTCTYAELPELWERTWQYLSVRGMEGDTCVSIECPNSLATAVLLTTLFRKGVSFAMVPSASNNLDLKPTPRFCQVRIKVLNAAGPFPADAFDIRPNPDFNGRVTPSGKLYLRTSGSMGSSKLVVHSHEKLIGNARNCLRKYNFNAGSRAVVPVPVAHMYGFGAEFLPAILAGASIDLQEKTNVLKYLDREKKFRPTIAFVTPAICDMLLKAFKSPRTGYEVVVTSGQRIGEELFRAFDPRVSGRLINQYGSTEMGATAACDPGDDVDRRATTIGRPLDGVELKLENGELHCRHPFGYEGYVDEDGDWLRRAAPDGWYHTGDLAAAQPDGAIVVIGRADASVNRSGYLVVLSDIERIFEKWESVGQVAVVAINEEGKRGQRIAAFCVLQPGFDLDGTQLRQRCFDVLPHHAIPDEVHVTPSLPLLPSGKVDRRALAALAELPTELGKSFATD